MKDCCFGLHKYSLAWTRQAPLKMTWNNNIHPRQSLEWDRDTNHSIAFRPHINKDLRW